MHHLITQFRAACLPFVTRTFRGQRWRRTLLLSGILAVLSVLTGLWLAQGRGEFEHEVRRELGVERSMWEREEAEYSVIVRDDWNYENLKAERSSLVRNGATNRSEYGQFSHRIDEGVATLRAATSLDAPPEHADLAERARLLLAAEAPNDAYVDGVRGFSWNDPFAVERLENIVDKRLVPDLVLYQSPVDAAGTVRFIGFVAGGLFAAMLLLAAPLLAGVQIAQEVHENTLQPVTGTWLSPRQLVIGLTSGPLAQVGVLAVPQVLLVLATAAVAGAFIPAVGFVLLAVVVGAFTSMLTQLIGLGTGKRRTPGIIGVGLLALLGGALLTGAGVGFNLEREMVGLVTIIPQSGVGHLLREAFAPAERLSLSSAQALDLRLLFAGLAYVVLAGVTHLALERRVAGRTGPSLRAPEAWVAVGTLIIAALLAMPDVGSDQHRGIATYCLTLGMLVIPFQLILMGRVTVGDAPAQLRTVPLKSHLATFAAFVVAHFIVVSIVVGGPQEFFPLSVFGAMHMAWGLFVAALIAVRAVAVPLRPLGTVWTSICLVLASIEFGMGVVFIAERHSGSEVDMVLPFFELSPVLGLLQLGLMFWVPISLVRALKKGSAGLA